jgi:hypothetical protein
MELDWFGFGSVGGVWAWALLFFSFFLSFFLSFVSLPRFLSFPSKMY